MAKDQGLSLKERQNGLTKVYSRTTLSSELFDWPRNQPLPDVKSPELGRVVIDRDLDPTNKLDAKYIKAGEMFIRNLNYFSKGDTAIIVCFIPSLKLGLGIYRKLKNVLGERSVILSAHNGNTDTNEFYRGSDEERIRKRGEYILRGLRLAQHKIYVEGTDNVELSEETRGKVDIARKFISSPRQELAKELTEAGFFKCIGGIAGPTEDAAKNLDMSFSEYERKFLNVLSVPSEVMLQRMNPNIEATFGRKDNKGRYIGKKGRFKLTVGNTELYFKVKGRPILRYACRIVDADGRFINDFSDFGINVRGFNGPDGEFFVSPLEKTAKGHLECNVPNHTIWGWVNYLRADIVDGVADPKTIECDNPEFLNMVLKLHEKDRSIPIAVGEIGCSKIGNVYMNPEIKFIGDTGKSTGTTLIDEKSYFHIAPFSYNINYGGKISQDIAPYHIDFGITGTPEIIAVS